MEGSAWMIDFLLHLAGHGTLWNTGASMCAFYLEEPVAAPDNVKETSAALWFLSFGSSP